MKNMKKSLWKVYVHTNRLNGKAYVGITKRCVKRRFYEHSIHPTRPFSNAIRKYGVDQWDTQIVCKTLSHQRALKVEHDCIAKLDSVDNGYNIARSGSTGNSGWVASDEFKRKTSDRMRLNPPMHDPEVKEKVRQFHLGRKRSDSTRLKLSVAAKNRPCRSKFMFHTPWGVFQTTTLAHEANPIVSASSIRRYCDGCDLMITKSMVSPSKYLTNDQIGMTLKDVGFYKEPII